MDRRELIRAFGRHWFGKDAFVAYPDHPLLSRGPDILGRDEKGIVAAFVYSSPWSRPTSPREQSRILLSRFALPADTAFWLIVADGSLPMSDDDVILFDMFLTLTQGDDRKAESSVVDSGIHAVLPVLRKFHTERFAAAWAPDNVPNLSEVRKPGFPTSAIHHTRYSFGGNWLNHAPDGSLSAAIAGGQSRAQLVSRVRSFSTVATSVDYGIAAGAQSLFDTADILKNGDGHLSLHRADIATNFLRSTTSNDVLKPFRAAAFAGAAVKYPRMR